MCANKGWENKVIYLLILIFAIVIEGTMLEFSCNSLKIKYTKTRIVIYLLIFGMLISQMLMYKPGSIVSPYAYSKGLLQQIEFGGQTLSSWFSIILFLYCIAVFFMKGYSRVSKNDVFILGILTLFCVMGVCGSDNIINAVAQGIKIILPFVVFFVLKNNYLNKEILNKFLVLSNYVLVIQVLMCKILTGKFAASKYYMEYQEEFFGFYNHPHNFTGLLGILSIWNIYRIYRKENRYISFIILICNIVLMYISGSRSYVVTLIVSITLLAFFSYFVVDLKKIRNLSTLYFVIVILFGGILISRFGANRVVQDISSGRIERWIKDLIYYKEKMPLVEKLIGGGFDFIYVVNQKIFGVYINSLNIFVDYLVNNGIIGLILIIGAYTYLFRFFIKNGNRIFSYIVLLFMLSSSMITNMVLYQVVMVYAVLILFSIGMDYYNYNENYLEYKE